MTFTAIKRLVPVLLLLCLAQVASGFYDPSLGRWINRDPVEELGGRNLYTMVRNCPTGFVDLFGLKPGDSYPSLDAAARAALEGICKKCKDKDKEHCGELYEKPDGTFTYDEASEGQAHGCSHKIDPKLGKPAGAYHCHGAESGPAWDDENFSVEDKKNGDRIRVPAYLVTPSKVMKKYYPDPNKKQRGKVERLGTCPCK